MGRERALAVLLAGLLAVVAPSALASESNISVNASIVNAPEKGWYAFGEVVAITAELVNDGDASSITVDPSCNEVIKVWSDDELIIDGSEACLGQSRGLDLGSYSTTNLPELTWDLTDSNGNPVPSGDYTIEYFVAGEELSSTVTVHVQSLVEIPDGLEMIVIATARDGVHAESSPSILSVRLHNTMNYNIDFDFGDCKVVVNDELLNACGTENLRPHEIVTISQIPVELSQGANLFDISLGSDSLKQTIEINAIQDDDQGTSSGDLTSMDLELILEGDDQFGEFEIFNSEISLINNGQDDVSLDFTNSCRGEYWIVDSTGTVVTDSRAIKDCSELEVEYQIEPGTERMLAQPEWTFIDLTGCHIAPGELTVVMEIPEHDLFATDSITLIRDRDAYCDNSEMIIEADLVGEDTLTVSPKIITETESELNWFRACGLSTTLYYGGEEIELLLSECEYDSSISMLISQISLESIQFNMDGLDEGEYTLVFETTTAPMLQSSISFDWPILIDEIENEDEIVTNDEVTTWMISGTWTSTTNDIGTCWLLNTENDGILTLANSQTPNPWSPQRGATGEYLISESTAAPECSDFATTSFTVQEVYSQEIETNTPIDESEVAIETPVVSEEEEISPAIVTVGVVVASSGILTLLFALIATNESWRIPATSAGLWLLALVGRTSETSDGRYQRGRLMGYLTANPGCHFRALMAALEMSNGQITHHLKILEDEDRIWRRPDGRLVRFYPFTSNLHPGILEEDLPLPPLSPDPNSLQGKILRLLDDDGQMNKSPTQAELAHRLDRSQQLVSHHLRTLQKFGLVEKQRSGVKNRYCLTREATFLLETTEL